MAKKGTKNGEKLLGMLIALVGAELGAAQIGQYGVKADTSPRNVLLNAKNTDGICALDILGIEPEKIEKLRKGEHIVQHKE